MEQQGKEIVCGKADEANMLKRIVEDERSVPPALKLRRTGATKAQ
jgi:hypothetical protein